MSKIIKLSKAIIDEIAAGEVIEKPASIIKELIENSIDAMSTDIKIFVEEAGKKKITIIDNGIGIDEKYLEVAVERYATSKVYNKSLSSVKTLGFRGEALYAIASTSTVIIISKTESMNTARKIKVQESKVIENLPSKGDRGTRIEVSDLFRNAPVRKKFLKSDRAEIFSIREVIKHIAVSQPRINFLYYEDRQLKYNFINTKKLNLIEERIVNILSNDFLKSSFKININSTEFNVVGYLSIPTFSKSSWNDSTIVVNKRVIKDRLILGAIKGAYSGLISGNRFPVIVLFIQINDQRLDVNVHPSKTEIRILDRYKLNALLIKEIRKTLESLGLRSSIQYEKDISENIQVSIKNLHISKYINQEENSLKNRTLSNDILKDNKFPRLGFAIAQINNMFIISQTKHKLIIVDQHAAHERIVLEQIKDSYLSNNVPKQTLLIPEILNLNNDKQILINNIEEIAKLGITLEDYGEREILVREIPAVLGKINIKHLFEDLIEKLKVTADLNLNGSNIDEVFSAIACHNSIRAGRQLNIEEMNALLRKMEVTKNSGQCNHGRPTFMELDLKFMEKLFGRT